jgi:hypothetical protein
LPHSHSTGEHASWPIPHLPIKDGDKADLLEHFAAKLPHYAAKLEVSDAETASAQAAAAAFRYDLQAQQLVKAYGQHWTNHKNSLRDGGEAHADLPPPLGLPPAPPAVAPGVIARFTALAARIKNHKDYTPAIGQDLGIVGSAKTIDPSSWKPSLGIQKQAGRPTVTWTKGDADAIEIWVDRGDGFRFLAVDLKPDHPDTAPLPTPGSSAVWKYKAIYLLDDAQVGE